MIKTFHCRVNGQRGFTLIEVMAALVVFSLLTLGLAPLLLSSLKGSELSQSYTIGKNLALEAMERVRGLPYHVKFDTQPDGRPIDVLDLYYPRYVLTGTFPTTCDETTVAAPACPKRVPEGYSVSFNATFVKPGGTADAQTYTPITDEVSTTYAWDSADDRPASQILEMSITVEWMRGGEPKQSRLKTLLSDRKFGEVTIRGNGKIDYGVEVNTGYIDPTGASSLLTATAGDSEALIVSKTTTTANETVRSAELRLVEVPADPSTVGADIPPLVEGAKGIYHAPPNSSPGDASSIAQVLTHPFLDPEVDIAGIDSTRAENIDVGVTNELPLANGSFEVGNPGTASDDLWVAPQVSSERASLLKLNTSRPLFFMHPGGTEAMTGWTTAAATDIAGADRKVETTAAVLLSDIRMLPTTFIGSSEGAVVVIDDFQASVSCKSTGDPVSAGASATWSATLRYWRDTTNTIIGVRDGSYSPSVTLSGADGVDKLAGIRSINPLVYDGLTPLEDVYLFDDPVNGKVGYLADWGSLFDISSTGATEDVLGMTTTAAVDGALSINSAPTGTTAESGLKVNLGKLNCEAVDGR